MKTSKCVTIERNLYPHKHKAAQARRNGQKQLFSRSCRKKENISFELEDCVTETLYFRSGCVCVCVCVCGGGGQLSSRVAGPHVHISWQGVKLETLSRLS